MDWQAAIKLNRDALLRLLAALVAITVPTRQTRNMMLRVLRPAESAARRLIVMAARGLNVSLRKSVDVDFSRLPSGRTSKPVPCFKLFDPRKRFTMERFQAKQSKAMPRISVPAICDPMFAAPRQTPAPGEAISAARLAARLAALQNALDTLPAQARRLARACLKRKSMPAGPRAVPPLRPGLAPGYKKRGRGEIDEILRECDALARDALAAPP